MAHYLNREAMRVVVRNENNGRVTKRTRYKRGDKVNTSDLVEGRLDALVEAGVLVESKDDVRDPLDPMGISPSSALTGAATGEAGRGPDAEEMEGTTPDDGSDSDDDSEDDDDADSSEEHLVDSYDEMDYNALRSEASKRNVDGSGSADAIRERLREADKA